MKYLFALMMVVLASVSTGWSHDSYAEAADFSEEAEFSDDMQEMNVFSYQEWPNTKVVAEALIQNKSHLLGNMSLGQSLGDNSVTNCLKDFTCHFAIVGGVWWNENRVSIDSSFPRLDGYKLNTRGCSKEIQQVNPVIVFVNRADNNYDIRSRLIALNGGDDKWIFDPRISICK